MREGTIHIRMTIGRNAGSIVEMPLSKGLDLVNLRRAERIDSVDLRAPEKIDSIPGAKSSQAAGSGRRQKKLN